MNHKTTLDRKEMEIAIVEELNIDIDSPEAQKQINDEVAARLSSAIDYICDTRD